MNAIRRFFAATDSAFNLAVFRIVLMLTILCQLDDQVILWYSSLPPILFNPPVGGKLILDLLPYSSMSIGAALLLCRLASLLGMIGLFSRISITIATITGAYVLLAPHVMNSAPHQPHLIWFAALLACSPASDALSIDSLLRARTGKTTPVPAITRSHKYGVALQFVWLLFGTIFFWPGFWKLTRGGADWLFGDGLVRSMHFRWFIVGLANPLRVDRFPLLCRLAAATVSCFELSFFLLILKKRTRWIAALLALLFHNLTNLVMAIPFAQLQSCYSAFFDWRKIFAYIGIALFKTPLRVGYKAGCPQCQSMIYVLKSNDLFQRVRYGKEVEEAGSDSVCLHRYCVSNRLQAIGQWKALAARLPIAMPLLLLNQVLDRLHIARPDIKTVAVVPVKTTAVVVVGSILLCVNNAFGCAAITHGWPFACYPIYVIPWDYVEELAITITDPSGRELALDLDKVWTSVRKYQKFAWMYEWTAKDAAPPLRNQMLQTTWELLVRDQPNWGKASTVRFYTDRYSTNPDNPRLLQRILLYQLNQPTQFK